jgi:hypothetical protein
MVFNSKQIGSYQPPPSHGQIAAGLAGNSANSGSFSVMSDGRNYAGIGVPVYTSPSTNVGVGAFATGNKMPSNVGAGIGFRFNF